jgi:hypothetical protein
MGVLTAGGGLASPGRTGSIFKKRKQEGMNMKTTRKTISVALIGALLMVLATTGIAMAADSITGTVAEKGEIIVLDAADSSYVLEGSDKAPEMIGKKVKVTGTIAEKDNVKVITVLSIEEVTE